MMPRIGDLKRALKRKVIGSPTEMAPPNLAAMLDNAMLALTRPGAYTEGYVKNMRIDVEEAKNALEAIELALPTLDKRAVKEWKKRKRTRK